MKKMLKAYMDGQKQQINLVYPQLLRQKGEIITKTSTKTYGIVYDKCKVMPNTVCLPYGYQSHRP